MNTKIITICATLLLIVSSTTYAGPTLSGSEDDEIIWPYDTWKAPDSIPTREFRRLRCFVLCRFDRAGTILPMIRNAASIVQNTINHEIQVYYAGEIVGSSAIHPDIWTHILQADIIVADITGYNPNVMYELGLLHEASKPTILMADKDTLARLPFDIRTRMVITFEARSEASDELTQAVVVATGRLLALYEPEARQRLVSGALPPAIPKLVSVQLSIASFDWEKIKNDGASAVGRKGCSTINISPHDDGSFKGWRLKARCTGGDTIFIYVDLNGDIASVDVQ